MGNESSEKINGSCLCGAVKFEATPPGLYFIHCHCSNCRRAHGAAFVTWTGFKNENFKITSSPDNLTRYHTDTDATRSFCKKCGSTLFFESPEEEGEAEGEVAVALANLNGEPGLEPEGHYFVDHKAKWFPITDSLPQHGGESGDEPKK
jgi:hypothetical protein